MISRIKEKPRSPAGFFSPFFLLCHCMNMDESLTTLAVFRSPVVRHHNNVFIVMQLWIVDNLNYFFIPLTLKKRVVMISHVVDTCS